MAAPYLRDAARARRPDRRRARGSRCRAPRPPARGSLSTPIRSRRRRSARPPARHRGGAPGRRPGRPGAGSRAPVAVDGVGPAYVADPVQHVDELRGRRARQLGRGAAAPSPPPAKGTPTTVEHGAPHVGVRRPLSRMAPHRTRAVTSALCSRSSASWLVPQVTRQCRWEGGATTPRGWLRRPRFSPARRTARARRGPDMQNGPGPRGPGPCGVRRAGGGVATPCRPPWPACPGRAR